MTEANDQIATLRELLPEIEGAEGALADETLGRVWCALHGVDYILAIDAALPSGDPTFHIQYKSKDEDIPVGHFSIAWERRWDTDLTAADDLVKEMLPGWARCSWRYGDGSAEAELSTLYQLECTGRHPTSEPRAILAALVRARIAELEAKDAK